MKFQKISVGFLFLVLTGCGGNEGPLMQGGTANFSQMKTTKALNAVKAFVDFTKISATGMPTLLGAAVPASIGVLSVGNGAAEAFVANPYANCKTNLISKSTDADADGIPVNVKIKYNCLAVPATTPGKTTTGKMIGVMETKDFDDTVKYARGGYSYLYDLFEVNAEPPGPGYPGVETTWKGTYSGQVIGSQVILKSDFKYAVKGDHAPVAPSTKWTKLDWSQQTQHTSKYRPTNINSIYTSGTAEHRGFYKMEGYVGPNAQGTDLGQMSVTFEISSSGLVYDNACAAFYKSGSVIFKDGGGNRIEMVYSCTGVKIYMNGTLLGT